MATSIKNIPQELKENYFGSDVETVKQKVYSKQRKQTISGCSLKEGNRHILSKILIKLIIVVLVILLFAFVFTYLEERF
jgi:hypothetical protein